MAVHFEYLSMFLVMRILMTRIHLTSYFAHLTLLNVLVGIRNCV